MRRGRGIGSRCRCCTKEYAKSLFQVRLFLISSRPSAACRRSKLLCREVPPGSASHFDCHTKPATALSQTISVKRKSSLPCLVVAEHLQSSPLRPTDVHISSGLYLNDNDAGM